MCVFGYSIKTDILNHPYFLSPFSEKHDSHLYKSHIWQSTLSHFISHIFVHGIMVKIHYIYDRRTCLHTNIYFIIWEICVTWKNSFAAFILVDSNAMWKIYSVRARSSALTSVSLLSLSPISHRISNLLGNDFHSISFLAFEPIRIVFVILYLYLQIRLKEK